MTMQKQELQGDFSCDGSERPLWTEDTKEIRVAAAKSAVYHKCNTFIQYKDGKDW